MKTPILFLSIFVISSSVLAQSNLSFFHMQNRLPQSTNYNAAYFPDSRIFISLPAISGIDLTVNNSFSISDILVTTGDSTLLDIDGFLESQGKRSYFNVGLGITDFMVGVRLNEESHFSVFINERLDATFFYPMDVIRFLWQGNGAYIGKKFVADDLSADVTYYREIGGAYARKFTIAGKETYIGARLKYLTGLYHLSSKRAMAFSILTNESDYSLEATIQGAKLRMAGFSHLETLGDNPDYSYMIFNGNRGFGLDIGAQTVINEKLRLGLAINDMGAIRWKEHAEQASFDDVHFRYTGINLDNMDEFEKAFTDSLESIDIKTSPAPFTTTLNTRTYITGDYNVTKGGYAQASIANYMTQGRMKASFGIGYLQNVGNWFSVTTTASITPQQGVDMGGGLMIKGGYLQFYAIADNIFNTINIPEARSANIKFGFNILIGKNEPRKKKSPKPVIKEPEVKEPEVKKSEPVDEKEPKEEEVEETLPEYPDYEHLWDKQKKKDLEQVQEGEE